MSNPNNGHGQHTRVQNLSTEDQDLVAAFLAKNKVTKCPPSSVTGNEIPQHVKRHIAEERVKFRQQQKEQK